jgi:hypothetical protein
VDAGAAELDVHRADPLLRTGRPPVLRALAEWGLITVANGTVAAEFRQVPYAEEWAAQWGG